MRVVDPVTAETEEPTFANGSGGGVITREPVPPRGAVGVSLVVAGQVSSEASKA